ncbi:Kinesin light chain 1 [Ilyonectria robusta]
MESRKTKLGADHPSILTSMANLASTYADQGRWEKAEKLEVEEPGPVGGGREARGGGDENKQDEAWGRPSRHAKQHGQPGVDI